MQGRRLTLVHILASPLGVKGTLRGQLRYLRDQGFDVHVITSPSDEIAGILSYEGVSYIPIRMDREIAPWRDMWLLWRLWRELRRLRPDICHVGMPKAGLLGGVAASMARVPCRIYTLHGLRLETIGGWKKGPLTWAERCACASAHRVICVGDGLRRKAIALGLVPERRCVVIGRGSANGVEVRRFAATAARLTAAHRIREQLGIPQAATVIGFVGRLTRDKGIGELVQAFEQLKEAHPDLYLMLVGPLEEGDPVQDSVRSRIRLEARIVHVGHVDDTAPYYHAMDIASLPSYREGLPTVVLEAGAAGKPVVGSDATGMADALVDGHTGVLSPAGDASTLAHVFTRLLDDPEYARALGLAAHGHIAAEFRQKKLWNGYVEIYRSLLSGSQPARGTLAGSPIQ